MVIQEAGRQYLYLAEQMGFYAMEKIMKAACLSPVYLTQTETYLNVTFSPAPESPFEALSHGIMSALCTHMNIVALSAFRLLAHKALRQQAVSQLRARFERLILNPEWTVALVDPFSLYVIVLDELWLQADGIMKKVAEVFNGMETVRT